MTSIKLKKNPNVDVTAILSSLKGKSKTSDKIKLYDDIRKKALANAFKKGGK